MTRPSDIPEDVWKAAIAAVYAGRGRVSTKDAPTFERIARAIMAAKAEEREQCAVDAVGGSADFDFEAALAECRDLEVGIHSGRIAAAAAIRKGGV